LWTATAYAKIEAVLPSSDWEKAKKKEREREREKEENT